jgi:3-hydroxyisobutyrate dehydrogenase-like beta-hydroxyacid dehydrogenase
MELKLGLVGLGAIGQIYAGHLVRANKQLFVFDRIPERMQEAEALGATPMISPHELAAHSDVIVLALPSPEAVEHAMADEGGILGGARAGTLVLDASTIDPDTSVRMYRAAGERGVSYLDAPVSGGEKGGAGTDGARAATISFMVGGDEEAFERAQAVMAILGKRWFYLGPAGSGSTVKLISNLMAGLHNLVATEAFVLGAACGIAPETLLDVFDGTDAKSFWLTEYFAPRILRKDFEPGFSVDLQYKDHRLAGELGKKYSVPLLFNELAMQFYQMMRAQSLGGKDLVESVNFWGKLANADIYHPRSREH